VDNAEKAKLIPHLLYLEKEFEFLPSYAHTIDWRVYQNERSKRLEVERWVECIINATLDVSKMLLATKRETLPETSRDILFQIGSLVFAGENEAIRFSELARMRNTLAHRYLDIRWQDIERFLRVSSELLPPFFAFLRREMEQRAEGRET
jgi:uncharacterized protein YutE (UPF0331/DUF86 family)